MRHIKCVLVIMFIAASAAAQWNPVKVNRDAAGWPHHFLVWKGKQYQPALLVGYGNIWFGDDDAKTIATLDDLKNNHANFARMWLRPSDGFYAFGFDAARGKVDLDTWNDGFFDRVNTILGWAEERGIVIEVMLWDRTTGWRGNGLPVPGGWDAWHTTGDDPNDAGAQNVHHPVNHYRSSAGDASIPGLLEDNETRIQNAQWYDTSNGVWMDYQQRYADRLIQELQKHNNVTLELINEAPSSTATAWRKFVHRAMRQRYPELLLQSEAIGGLSGADDDIRAFGAQNPGLVDMVSTHSAWTYNDAQNKYLNFPGVVPGCNEGDGANVSNQGAARRQMWGLVFGGGSVNNESIPSNVGAVVTSELYLFFYPAANRPSFSTMRPAKSLVAGNDGNRYVLARDDRSEILVFVSGLAGTGAFHVNGSGSYQYRWFSANGAASSWSAWSSGSSWDFTPPAANSGLQIVGSAGTPAPGNLTVTANLFDVTLNWSDPGSGATSYRIQRMDDNSGLWNQVGSVRAGVTTFTQTVPAPPSGGSNFYSYRINAITATGGSSFSNTASITIYADPPAVPVLIGPQGCVSTLRPTYTWNPAARASRYYLAATRVDVEDFFINDPNVIGTSYPSPADLIPGLQYRWKAKACNNIGCSGYAPSMYFTPFCAPTTPPTMLSPKDCVGTRRPTITWSSVPGATSYKIAIFSVVDVTNDVLVYYVDVAGTSYTPPANLVAGQEYRAKVKAINNGASGPFSAHRYFTPMCSATQKAGSASPIAPNAATPNQTPAFTWESASSASTYTLYVKTSAGTLVTQTTYSAASICSATECSVPSPAAYATGSYYWQVLSSNAYGSSWSANAAFTTP